MVAFVKPTDLKIIFNIEVLFLCYLKELQQLHTDDLLVKQSWTLKRSNFQHLFEYEVLAKCLIYWKWALDNHDSLYHKCLKTLGMNVSNLAMSCVGWGCRFNFMISKILAMWY